jgi:hypothetical protein
MDVRRARIGEWLSGGLGAALVLSLFLPWYCSPDSRSGCERASGWESFAVVDLVVLAAGAIAVAALVLTLTQRTPALPLAVTSLGAFVALAGAVLAVVRLAAPPDLTGAGGEAASVRLIGAWLGAGAALGLLGSLLAAVRDERIPSEPRMAEEQAAAVRTISLSRPPGPKGSGGSA